MKNKMIAITALLVAFSTGSFAQESATASATATIVTPLSIEKVLDMNFGNVSVQSTAGGTAVLEPLGTASRSRTDGVTFPTLNGTVTAASFTVAGQEGYTYAVTLPSVAVTLSSDVNTMTVTTFTSSPGGTDGDLTGGSQTLYVGATLNVGAAQPAGTYVSDTDFTVTVNYN